MTVAGHASNGSEEMPTERPLCAEHTRLLEAYQKAVARFSSSMTALREAALEDCDRFTFYTEQARLCSERARIAWEAHRMDHGCVPSPFG